MCTHVHYNESVHIFVSMRLSAEDTFFHEILLNLSLITKSSKRNHLKGTGTRDLIWPKVVSLDRSWLVGLTEEL